MQTVRNPGCGTASGPRRAPQTAAPAQSLALGPQVAPGIPGDGHGRVWVLGGIAALLLIVLQLVAAGCGGSHQPEPASAKLDEETLRTLHAVLHADGLLDENQLRQLRDMTGRGEEICPVLCEILRETDDLLVANHALYLLVRANCDKETVVEEIRGLLGRYSGKEEHMVSMRLMAVRSLGQIGTEKDCAIIYPLLDDDDMHLRANVIRTIGQIGGEEAIEKIEASLAKRRKRMSEAEIATDPSFAEAKKATESIRARMRDTAGPSERPAE